MNRRSFIRLGGLGLLSAAATMALTRSADAAAVNAGTPVIQIEAQANVHIRALPGLHGRIWGKLWAGYSATVLAISADRGWWCIRYGRGTAWVSADPGLTQPIAWRR